MFKFWYGHNNNNDNNNLCIINNKLNLFPKYLNAKSQ